MKNRGTVPEQPTTGEVVDVICTVLEQVSPLVKRMNREEIKVIASRKGRFGRAFRQALTPGVEEPWSPEEILEDWQQFSRLVFGAKFVPEAVEIPKMRDDFTRVIIYPKGLTLNRIFGACKERFNSWSYWEDPDRTVTINDRIVSENSYAILVRDRIEADEELSNFSAVDLTDKKILGITLGERLLYELKYYGETGVHLDCINTVTLCSGSRSLGHDVPGVSGINGQLRAYNYAIRSAHVLLRARAVVSV